MATFVLVHGAWHGAWCWRRVTRLLTAHGHEVFAPTLTGVGERSHLRTPAIDLDHPRAPAVGDLTTDDDGSPGRAQWIEHVNGLRDSIDHWGEGRTVDWAAPSVSRSALYRRAVGALERAGMSPRMALIAWQAGISQVDVRDILGSVRVPTLVLQRRDEVVPVEYGRELAAKIPDARLVELDGVDHWPGVGDIRSITGEIEEFLTVSATSTRSTASWPRCCSPTSSIPPDAPLSSETNAGVNCSSGTMRSPAPKLPASKVAS